jgi:hypothetical protein
MKSELRTGVDKTECKKSYVKPVLQCMKIDVKKIFFHRIFFGRQKEILYNNEYPTDEYPTDEYRTDEYPTDEQGTPNIEHRTTT